MRILAVRGRSIASLAGDFDIDLRREPLLSAGIFAICGPTGAGKSTLLDALCLALYDDTPRLHKAAQAGRVPDVGDETLTAHDPRNLLSRGAAEGWAEVDFAAQDGEEYRARWSVRRSRGRISGRLQASESSLVRIVGMQNVPGTKVEVLKRVRDLVGLDFDQFTRAVLLAQNEFTAFLQADDNKRAELLEQLTGTDLFSTLSTRAYERAKDEREALDLLVQEAAAWQPLSAEERTDLEHRLAHVNRHLDELQAETNAIHDHLRWHKDLNAAREEEEHARQALGLATTAWTEAQSRREQIAFVEAVQPAAPWLTEYDRVTGQVRESREKSLPDAERHAQEAERLLAEAAGEAASARSRVEDAERAPRDAGPALDRAFEVDGLLAGLERRSSSAAASRNKAVDDLEDARVAFRSAEDARDECKTTKEEAELWLELNDDRRMLAESWDRWESLFAQAARARRNVTDAVESVRIAEEDNARKNTELGTAVDATRTADEKLKEALQLLDDAEKIVAAFDVPAITLARRTAHARRALLTAGEAKWKTFLTLDQRLAGLRETAGSLRDRLEENEREQHDTEQMRIPAVAARDEARLAYEEVHRACAKNVEKLRGTLEAGRPCPVCGSVEHPYVTADSPLDEALEALKLQLGEREQALAGLERQAARLQADIEADRSRQQENQEQLAAVQADSDVALADWKNHRMADETVSPEAAGRQEWFKRELLAIESAIVGAENQENQAADAIERRDLARRAYDAARTAFDAATATEHGVRADARMAAGTAEGCRKALEVAQEQLEDVLKQLDAAYSDEQSWRSSWHEDPDAFQQAQFEGVEAWRKARATAANAGARLGTLAATLEGHNNAVSKCAEELRLAEEAVGAADQELADARKERTALFGGKQVAEVRKELQDTLDASRIAAGRTDETVAAAREAKAVADARLEEARSTLKTQIELATRAADDLTSWIAGHNVQHQHFPTLNMERLRALLSYEAPWLRQERDDLQQLDSNVGTAKSVYEDRCRRRKALEAEAMTEETAESLAARRADVSGALEREREEHGTLRSRLANDDERAERLRGFADAIRSQRALATLWEEMSELIGSADGKKFRNYAQQLTLDVLLQYANRHLDELSRRYQVRRLKERLALAVIDRDMGDEIRSVHSLSGGESFLVSLALALGLASLSANRVRVESLFIDEGFGSLDADTLTVAIDALDRLHAQGRKVGVISHVQEMTERIGTRVMVERQSGGRSRVTVA